MLLIEPHRTGIGWFCSRKIKKSLCVIKRSYNKDRNLTEWTCFCKVLVLANVLSFNLAIKAYQLTWEGIGSNPGSRNHAIKKGLLPSWRLSRNAMYKHSVFFIIYSAVKRVGLWKLLDLDIILAQGDELFKSVRIK